MEYQIQPNTRCCAISGEALEPGERYYTVLFDEGQRWVRKDYSVKNWEGPPEGAFSFWLGRVPESSQTKKPPIDEALLLDCFHRLEGNSEPQKVNFRYVLSLLLMRRKRLKFEDVRNEKGQETLILTLNRGKGRYEVVNPHLTEEEIAAVQEEVMQVLGWD